MSAKNDCFTDEEMQSMLILIQNKILQNAKDIEHFDREGIEYYKNTVKYVIEERDSLVLLRNKIATLVINRSKKNG